MTGPDYDFIVVGTGAAGAAVANRLVEGGAKVLVAERGGKAAIHQDAMEAVYRYYTHGSMVAATGNCLLPLPTGRTVGGTTTINSGTCMRTPDDCLENWEAAGGGFKADAFRRYNDEAWSRINVRRAPEETMSESSRLFLAGLDKLGIAGGHRLDRCEKGCVGSGRCCFVCPSGGKMTSDKAFLSPLEGKPGYELLTGASLIHIDAPRREGDLVWLALRDEDGRTRWLTCRKAVLACGALASPYFVRRFRLGRRHREAGNGLSVHPASKIFAYFERPIQGWKGVPQGAGLEDPEDPRIRYEGVYTPPELAAITLPLGGRGLHWWMQHYDRVATFGFMIRDESRGTVRHPLREFPLIRYSMEDGDTARMLKAMRFVGRTFFAAGAEMVVLPINREPNVFESLKALEAADFSGVRARDLQMMAFHPLGTCAMGTVVDDDLRLCEGVYVCDGSVVPESLGVNPQVTIYSFALRLGDHLLGKAHAS